MVKLRYNRRTPLNVKASRAAEHMNNPMSIKEKVAEIKGYLQASSVSGGFGAVGGILILACGAYSLGYMGGKESGRAPQPESVPAALPSRVVSLPTRGAEKEQKTIINESVSKSTEESNTVATRTPEREATTTLDTQSQKGAYVGSRRGKKYHLPDCPGAKTILDTNKVWFASKAEAEARGYTPAGNCKGI
jgi:hypothetical protein